MQRLNLFNELKSVSAGRLFQGATTRVTRSVKKCFLIPRIKVPPRRAGATLRRHFYARTAVIQANKQAILVAVLQKPVEAAKNLRDVEYGRHELCIILPTQQLEALCAIRNTTAANSD